MNQTLKAPFPWFGGKSRVAHLVWERFGDVPNYVEPFFGSGAVLLGRPHEARVETVNDKDCYLSNFWRAVQHDAGGVARHADWPVNESDLHSRHRWLVNQHGFRERLMADPDYYDAKIAGWWVWGIAQWIGSGWCSRPEWMGRTLPGRSPRGIHTDQFNQRPSLSRVRNIGESQGWKKRPNLNRSGRGVTSRLGQWQTRPFLTNDQGVAAIAKKMPVCKRNNGSGVLRSEIQNANPSLKRPGLNNKAGLMRPSLQLPDLSGDSGATGRGVFCKRVRENLLNYMLALQDRLRRVRVCCGDWERILGPSPTTCIGLTGVFLDPPYSASADRDASIYNVEDLDVAHAVREWAIQHGHNPKLRIALCGYEGEHAMPKSWTCLAWKANGGYGNQSRGRGFHNARRERIWFSPYCIEP